MPGVCKALGSILGTTYQAWRFTPVVKVQSHPGLPSEFKASVGSVGPKQRGGVDRKRRREEGRLKRLLPGSLVEAGQLGSQKTWAMGLTLLRV